MKHDTDALADDAIESALAKARSIKDGADDVVGDLLAALNKSVRDQPLATLAAAIGIGLVAGAVFKR